MNVSRDGRLLFVGLITQADDCGRGSADRRKLRAQIFPADDDIDAQSIEKLLLQLQRETLIVLYTPDGFGELFALPTWHLHQKIDRPQPSRYPAPTAETTRSLDDDSSTARRMIDETSSSARRGIGSGSGSVSGIEDQGTFGLTEQPERRRATRRREIEPPEFTQIRERYPRRAGSQRWPQALGAYRARLREGHSAAEIAEGVERYAAFVAAQGRAGTEFVMQALTFFGSNRAFLEPWELPPPKPNGGDPGRQTRADRMRAQLDELGANDDANEF